MLDICGFVVIDKPAGITSHSCIARLRKVFGIKRIGHGGTLDPSVTGVLPIAIGNATRLLSYLPGKKTYVGKIQLGKRTKTDDLQGEIIQEMSWPKLNKLILEEYITQFLGAIQQKPPQVSSVHINGVRAYKRAREGEVFDLPYKNVYIYTLNVLEWCQESGLIKIFIECSSGTYIRSLARDLGEKIGCGGCLFSLRRIKAMGFIEEQATPLPKINENQEPSHLPEIINPLIALKNMKSTKLLNEEELLKWRTGRSIVLSNSPVIEATETETESFLSSNSEKKEGIIVIDPTGEIAGIGNLILSNTIKPKIVFNALG